MKNPQDLCRVEYHLYHRRMHQICHLAQAPNSRLSENLLSLLDYTLMGKAPSAGVVDDLP